MILCFDIGGTTIRAAVSEKPGDLQPVLQKPTPTDDFDAFVGVLAEAIAAAGAKPDCLALAFAGIVDSENRRTRVANIPCIDKRRLDIDVMRALGIDVVLVNDADCFALAEAVSGSGQGHEVVFGLILGSGIGGGLVVRGRLINTDGHAGEWGHGPVAARVVHNVKQPLPAFRCGCGLDGCLNAICSARGIERLHKHLWGADLTSTELLENARYTDRNAYITYTVWLEMLSGPLAMLANVTGATVMPVGGGLANVPNLISEINDATAVQTLERSGKPLLVPATSGPEPGLIGAAILARQRHVG